MAISPKQANKLNDSELLRVLEEKLDEFLKENYEGKPLIYELRTSECVFVNTVRGIYEAVGWKVAYGWDMREGKSWLTFTDGAYCI